MALKFRTCVFGGGLVAVVLLALMGMTPVSAKTSLSMNLAYQGKPQDAQSGLLATPEPTSTPDNTPQLRNPRMLHDKSLITNEPCAAPCWQGITPGVTLWNDAVKLLQRDTTFVNFEFQDVTDGDDKGSKTATWQEKDGEKCCQMLSSKDGKIVRAIGLQLAPDSTLGRLNAAQGTPAYVLPAGGDNDQALIALVYPDTPMVVYAFVAGTEKGALRPSSEIVLVSYLAMDDMNNELKQAYLHDWQGYQSYQWYKNSPFTLTPEPAS